MLNRLNILPIVKHEYQPFAYRSDSDFDSPNQRIVRRFDLKHFLLFLVLPVVLGVLVFVVFGAVESQYLPLTISVTSIIAAVMTGFLPLVHTITGVADVGKRLDRGDYIERRGLLVRLAVLRDLYANAAFAVVLSLASLLPQLLVGIPTMPAWAVGLLSIAIYSVGFMIALLFLKIISGVYEVLDLQGGEITERIRRSAEAPLFTQQDSEQSPEEHDITAHRHQ